MQKLPPAAEGADTLAGLLADRGSGSSPVYLVTLLVVALALASLPVIRIPVVVRSAGVLRSSVEPHEVRTGASGIVDSVLVSEGAMVSGGERLLQIRVAGREERLAAIQEEISRARDIVRDLELMTKLDPGTRGPIAPEALSSPRHRRAAAELGRAVAGRRPRTRQLARETARLQALADRRLVPAAEVEAAALALEEEEEAIRGLVDRTILEWQTELEAERDRLRALRSERSRLLAESLLTVVTAPVGGTVGQVLPLSRGSIVAAGERVATVTPDTTLVAEVYASAAELGRLTAGSRVRIELEGFPASDWGMLTGRITSLASHATWTDEGPRYRIRITLDRDFIALRSGARMRLVDGMPLQARYTAGRQTLWTLLRGKIEDWWAPDRAPAVIGGR